MFNIIKSNTGFTLIELIVVIAILAILGVSAFVGFGNLGDNTAVKQVEGTIEDLMSQLETEILIERYQNTMIYFDSDYLIAVSDLQGSEPGLIKWFLDENNEYCSESKYAIKNQEGGNMTIKNEEGKVIQVKDYALESVECIDFETSGDMEWNIQIKNDEDYSSVVRFIHFNLDEEKQGQLQLEGGEALSLKLEGPYGKRTLYQIQKVADEFNIIGIYDEPVEIYVRSTESKVIHPIVIQP